MKYKLQGKIKLQGLVISVENRKGSVRSGTDPNGKKWKTKMVYPYGYILGVLGKDKDHLDCFVGDDRDSELVFVINQVKPWTKNRQFDEHKVMLGFNNEEEAKKAYLKHYDSPKYFGSITSYTMDDFKERIGFDKEGIKKVDGNTFRKAEDEYYFYIDIEKSKDTIEMPIEEFIDEHERLIGRLKRGNKKELDKERKEQEAELKNYKKKKKK